MRLSKGPPPPPFPNSPRRHNFPCELGVKGGGRTTFHFPEGIPGIKLGKFGNRGLSFPAGGKCHLVDYLYFSFESAFLSCVYKFFLLHVWSLSRHSPGEIKLANSCQYIFSPPALTGKLLDERLVGNKKTDVVFFLLLSFFCPPVT